MNVFINDITLIRKQINEMNEKINKIINFIENNEIETKKKQRKIKFIYSSEEEDDMEICLNEFHNWNLTP